MKNEELLKEIIIRMEDMLDCSICHNFEDCELDEEDVNRYHELVDEAERRGLIDEDDFDNGSYYDDMIKPDTKGYIYSEYLDEMIHKGFTDIKDRHWTWNETDLVYYRDDVDDTYIFYDDNIEGLKLFKEWDK